MFHHNFHLLLTFLFDRNMQHLAVSSVIGSSSEEKRRGLDVPANEPSAAFVSLGLESMTRETVDGRECSTFKVQQHMLNVPGGLHGGALAMTIEEAFRQSVASTHRKSQKSRSAGEENAGPVAVPWVQSMELRYLSTVKVIPQLILITRLLLTLCLLCRKWASFGCI